jgi:hypothetical protein
LRTLLKAADRALFRAESASPRPLEGRKLFWDSSNASHDFSR